jgi:hypothetical protein
MSEILKQNTSVPPTEEGLRKLLQAATQSATSGLQGKNSLGQTLTAEQSIFLVRTGVQDIGYALTKAKEHGIEL